MVETDPDTVYVSVSDTGCGISSEARPLIFERLYQQPGAVDSSVRMGLGLGLFISKELIRLQNGKIWVASEPGLGSTFTFTLPAYSLAKLLTPVITHEGRLRNETLMIRVELRLPVILPHSKRKDIARQCLEILQRCVYLDKDLVLPPMNTTGPVETFFVVASTDMERSAIMIARIRGQLERIPGVNAPGALTITATPLHLPVSGLPANGLPANDPGSDASPVSLEQQVLTVASRVSEIVVQNLNSKPSARPTSTTPTTLRAASDPSPRLAK